MKKMMHNGTYTEAVFFLNRLILTDMIHLSSQPEICQIHLHLKFVLRLRQSEFALSFGVDSHDPHDVTFNRISY